MRMFLFDVEWEKTKALPLQIKMKIFDSKQTICWGVVVEIINNVQMIEVYLKTMNFSAVFIAQNLYLCYDDLFEEGNCKSNRLMFRNQFGSPKNS